MSEAQAATTPRKDSRISAGLKTLLGGFAGLLSGALVMYLSPLLDKAIKPTKPVANFAIDQQGLTITLQNRSVGSGSGWWDFGDGSPLEPYVPGREMVTHTYTNPGDYSVKLSVRNGLGDENERTVPVRIEGIKGDPPRIEGLEAVPISPGSFAPATYRLTSRVKNAQVCVWDLGDERPLDIITEPGNSQERLVTFERPGGYVIKLAAVNGTRAVQKSEIINVVDPPTGLLTVVLKLTDRATLVETQRGPFTFSEVFPPESRDPTLLFTRSAMARMGHEIVEIRVPGPGGKELSLAGKGEISIDAPQTRNLQLKLDADRKTARLSGELVRDSRKREPTRLVLPVTLVQEKRTPVTRSMPVMAMLGSPGTVTVDLPPLPGGWIDAKRDLRLELRDGEQILYKEGELPRSTVVTVRGKREILTALAGREQVRIDLIELPRGVVMKTP